MNMDVSAKPGKMQISIWILLLLPGLISIIYPVVRPSGAVVKQLRDAFVCAESPSAISAKRPRNVAKTHTFGEMPPHRGPGSETPLKNILWKRHWASPL